MPDALKTELWHYAEYLLTKSDQTEEDKQAVKESGSSLLVMVR